MSYAQRWTDCTFDIAQCFTGIVALHCWSIRFHTFMMFHLNVGHDNDDV